MGSVLGCSSIKVHGGIFHNQLFWNSALDLFSQFSITGCRVFFTSTSLEHFFTVGPKLFSLMLGKICMFVAISDPIS